MHSEHVGSEALVFLGQSQIPSDGGDQTRSLGGTRLLPMRFPGSPMRLTRPNISRLTLSSEKSEQIIFCETLPGFGIRLRAGGKRTWIAQYRMGTQQRRVTIGSVEIIEPEDARRRAKEILAKVQLGGDPQNDKVETRVQRALTLGAVTETYLERYVAWRLRPKTICDTNRYLRVNWKPLHGLPLGKIDRRMIAARLAEIANERGRYHLQPRQGRPLGSVLLGHAGRAGGREPCHWHEQSCRRKIT